jgi:pimeloyl-ACP methyl ester carboxylesterase
MQELTQIQILDFGGTGPVLHLAHANGFPPGTYRLMAESLAETYHVIALPSRPLLPGSSPSSAPNWQPLTRDLIQGLDRLGLSHIVGVGHSLGAVLTLCAAIERPDLFHAIVLIEPVILPPAGLWMLRVLRRIGLKERQPLVQGALHRRRTWPSREACFEHLRGKPLFAQWSDAALADYVESGTRERMDGGVELAYPPEWEAQIFATTPTAIWHDLPRLHTRTLVIRGETSHTFFPAVEKRMARRLAQATFVTIPHAGHLVPMEQPTETAAAIGHFLDDCPT